MWYSAINLSFPSFSVYFAYWLAYSDISRFLLFRFVCDIPLLIWVCLVFQLIPQLIWVCLVFQFISSAECLIPVLVFFHSAWLIPQLIWVYLVFRLLFSNNFPFSDFRKFQNTFLKYILLNTKKISSVPLEYELRSSAFFHTNSSSA